jgi:hypothetical protein
MQIKRIEELIIERTKRRKHSNKSLELTPEAATGSMGFVCCGSWGSDSAAQLNSMLSPFEICTIGAKEIVWGKMKN